MQRELFKIQQIFCSLAVKGAPIFLCIMLAAFPPDMSTFHAQV